MCIITIVATLSTTHHTPTYWARAHPHLCFLCCLSPIITQPLLYYSCSFWCQLLCNEPHVLATASKVYVHPHVYAYNLKEGRQWISILSKHTLQTRCQWSRPSLSPNILKHKRPRRSLCMASCNTALVSSNCTVCTHFIIVVVLWSLQAWVKEQLGCKRCTVKCTPITDCFVLFYFYTSPLSSSSAYNTCIYIPHSHHPLTQQLESGL